MAGNRENLPGRRRDSPCPLRRLFAFRRDRSPAEPRYDPRLLVELLQNPVVRSSELEPSVRLPQPEWPRIDTQQLMRWKMFESLIKYESTYMHVLILLTLNCHDELVKFPFVLDPQKAEEIFAYMPEIRVLHQRFREWMAQTAEQWNERELAGWLFGALIEQPALFNAYSRYMANYKRAIRTAQPELQKRSLFYYFMESRLRLIESRQTFTSCFMKPVQRMIHMEQQIAELLGVTPPDHPDLPMLQLCGRRVKFIASQLNVLQGHICALREVLPREFPAGIPTAAHVKKWRQNQLLHCEDLQRTVVDRRGGRTQKIYRIYLLSDRVVFVGVQSDNSGYRRCETKLRLKWTLPLESVQLYTVSPSGVLHSHAPPRTDAYMQVLDLIRDSATVSEIGSLVGTLHTAFSDLNLSTVDALVRKCGSKIKHINDEAIQADKCYNSCDLLVAPRPDGPSCSRAKSHLVRFPDGASKRRWYCNARLTQRGLKSSPGSSAWWTDENQLFATNEPVFVDKLRPGCPPESSDSRFHQLSCVCYYAPNLSAPPYARIQPADWLSNRNTLWICSGTQHNTAVTLYTHELLSQALVYRTTFCLGSVHVECVVHVPSGQVVPGDDTTIDTVWMGATNRLLIYSASYPLVDSELARVSIRGRPVHMLHRANRVYIGLSTGNVLIYHQDETAWNVQMPLVVNVSVYPISKLLCVKGDVYVATGTSVYVLDGSTDQLRAQIKAEDEPGQAGVQGLPTPIICMAHSVNGMWLVRHRSTVVSLYRLSPWKHLQDIDLAGPVQRFAPIVCQAIASGQIYVTCIALFDNSLWVGTSVGITMMMALPACRNVPLIGEFMYGAKHGHLGSVNFLQPLVPAADDLCDPDEDEPGYDGIDAPPLHGDDGDDGDDGVDLSPLAPDSRYDSESSLYDTLWGASSSRLEEAGAELDSAEDATEDDMPTPPEECGAGASEHDDDGSSVAGGSVSSEPAPERAQVADTISVLVLAGGEGYLNFSKLDASDAPRGFSEPRFGPAQPAFDNDYTCNANIVVWEKRLNTMFQRLL